MSDDLNENDTKMRHAEQETKPETQTIVTTSFPLVYVLLLMALNDEAANIWVGKLYAESLYIFLWVRIFGDGRSANIT